MDVVLKDPAARIDVAVDWGAGWLGERTIVQSGWRVAPTGELHVVQAGVEGGRAMATLAGGEAGSVYRLTNEVVCTAGSIDARELVVRVDAR